MTAGEVGPEPKQENCRKDTEQADSTGENQKTGNSTIAARIAGVAGTEIGVMS
jgi:hypothetical protein